MNTGQQSEIIVKNSPDMVALFNPQGRHIYVNPALLRNFNLPSEHFLGKTIPEAYPIEPALGQHLFDALRLVIEEGLPKECEAHWSMPDGSHYFDVRHVPTFDESGQVVNVVWIARDITERKQAEERLALIELGLNRVPDAASIVSEDIRFLYVNEEACRILGYEREELLEMGVPDIDPDYPLSRLREHWKQTASNGSRTIFEAAPQAKDGRRIPLEISVNLFEHEGQGYSLTLWRDISEKRRAEQALAESESRFRRMVDTAPIMIWLVDANRTSIHLNQEAQRFIGQTVAEVCCHVWCSAIHPEDQARCIETFSTAFSQLTTCEQEYRLRHADGDYRWVVERGVPQFSPEGNFTGFIGTCADITERREAEQARLQEAIAQRSFVVREVHHRIKNHLQGLMGLLGRLEAQCPDASTQFQQAATQTQIIATIHGLQAKSESSQPELTRVIAAIVDMSQRLYDIPITLHYDNEMEPTYLDELFSVPVALVINELLLNAVKHGHYENRHQGIDVLLTRSPDEFIALVRNPGQLTSDMDDHTRTKAGTGLSLARLLMPTSCAELRISQMETFVEASVRLQAPLLVVGASRG